MLVVLTEGKDDEVFIEIYLEHLGYTRKADFIVQSIGGWNNIHLSKPKIDEFLDGGHNVVLVFDADGDDNGGGFKKRETDLKQILQDNGLELDIFLFPNANDDGDLEDLLERVSVQSRSGVFNCFDAYEACVKLLATNEISFITPNKKSRIFAYIESFPETKREKEKELKAKTKFLERTEYWDLNSSALNPLRDFLKNFIV